MLSRLSRAFLLAPQVSPEAKPETTGTALAAEPSVRSRPNPLDKTAEVRLRHGPFSALRNQVSHGLHPSPPSAQPGTEAAHVSRRSGPKTLDQHIRARLLQSGSSADVQLFDRCRRSIETSNDNAPDRAVLADLYASTMRASQLNYENSTDVRRCIAIGREALRLNPLCVAAEEQLAILFSCMCGPITETQRWIGRTVAHNNIWQLSSDSAQRLPEAEQGVASVSADFYFAYWRTYHQHPSRARQAAWALATYSRAPADQRHCDDVLAGLQMLGLHVVAEDARLP